MCWNNWGRVGKSRWKSWGDGKMGVTLKKLGLNRRNWCCVGEIGVSRGKLGLHWKNWGFVGDIGVALKELGLSWRNWGRLKKLESC